jgi:hypothetical protein
MKHLVLSLLALGCWFSTAAAVPEPELLPPPRLAERAVQVELINNGYKLLLSRPAAERLRDTLRQLEGEQQVADAIRGAAKGLDDEKATASAEVLAWVITRETPRFKKSLDEKMGANGVTVTVYGLQRGKDRPVLRAIGKALLPPQAQEKARAVLAITRTTPLYWSIDPRGE